MTIGCIGDRRVNNRFIRHLIELEDALAIENIIAFPHERALPLRLFVDLCFGRKISPGRARFGNTQ